MTWLVLAVLLDPISIRADQVLPSQFSVQDPVITFEVGTTLLPSVPGVSFAGGNSSFSYSGECYGHQYFGNFMSLSYSYLDIYFDQPQQAVGAYLVHVSSRVSGVTEVAYDRFGNMLESYSANFAPAGQPLAFLGIGFGDNLISRVEWRYTSVQGFFGVDNVIFGPAVVPEPSAGAMLALMTGLLFTRAARSTCGRAKTNFLSVGTS